MDEKIQVLDEIEKYVQVMKLKPIKIFLIELEIKIQINT